MLIRCFDRDQYPEEDTLKLLGGLSVEMLLGCLGIGFRGMHGAINMLWRRIRALGGSGQQCSR
jgi:hypothetical protein